MPDVGPAVPDDVAASSSSSAAPSPPPLTVWGIDRGREFGGAGWLEVSDDGVAVLVASARQPAAGAAVAGRYFYPLAAIDGVRVDALSSASSGDARAQLTVFLGGGDVVEATGAPGAVRALGRRLEDAACALTEQTLPLRGLGSHRANPGSDHDRFYGPLLAARRAAEHAATAVARVDAFDAPAIARALDRTLAAFAAERFPSDAPDRRALEAELRELAAPMHAALARLAEAAAATRAAPDDARFLRWRAWALVVRDVFAATDDAWLESLPTLCDSRGRGGRFWRRLLGRFGGRSGGA